MFSSLKTILSQTRTPIIFTVVSNNIQQNYSSGKKGRRVAYQISDRRKWTENEYYCLLHNSLMGKSRQQLHSLLGRAPGKIFSKIQKHMRTVEHVKSVLTIALKKIGKRDELITLNQLETAQANSF
jgi:hypothetical protein